MKQVIILFAILFLFSGCSIGQQNTLGANSDRTEGFSGYGVKRVQAWEGPLTDLMIPDETPKSLADPSKHLVGEGAYLTNETNLGYKHEGINGRGPRIFSNRPNVLRDRYAHKSSPYLEERNEAQTNQDTHATTDLTLKIEKRLENLNKVHDAHVITDGETILIGVESNEPNRNKLIRSVENEVADMTDIEHVQVTTSRKIINRMKALEDHVNLPRPFHSIGGSIGEVTDTVDDAIHHRR